ncbi:MAG: hypothetical protein MJ238_07595, partial [Bacilli bacterium]|nr:hypothetical protein [Bacilli bacterium]
RKALADDYPDTYRNYKKVTLSSISLVKDLGIEDKTVYDVYENDVLIGNICYLFIDHHLVKFSYSKMNDEYLLEAIQYLIGSILDNVPRLTVYFAKANKSVVKSLGLEKTIIRGKTAFAVKLKK